MKQKRLNIKALLILLSCAALSLWTWADVTNQVPGQVALTETLTTTADEPNLKLRYTFENVAGKTVPDISGSGYNGTLVNNASILTMGKYKVLSLGNNTGYLDMGAGVGNDLYATGSYTISAYYRVDMNATLSGNGFFLWTMAQQMSSDATNGSYISYRMNDQRFAFSTGGYKGEVPIQIGGSSTKGAWQHIVYRQRGTTGELYIDGKLAGSKTPMPLTGTAFSSAPAYNWIGRAPFSGDNYLKNTLVYDFRVYNAAVTDAQITEWATLTKDLEREFIFSTVGDFTKLTAGITQCKAYITSMGAGNFPPLALAEFEDAIQVAQELVDEQKVSQLAIDDCLLKLNAAKTKFGQTKGAEATSYNPMPAYNPEKGFVHPGALHTLEDFDRIKALLAANDPTIVAAYNGLRSNVYSQSTVVSVPISKVIRGGDGENYMEAARGGSMAYLNALRWRISGEKAHAEKAIQILNDWAAVCNAIGGDSNYALGAGLYGYAFANAAELMRGYEGWTPDNLKKVQDWMLNVWYPYCIGFLRGRNGTWEGGDRPGHYWSNWGLCNALAVMSIGVFCDDVFIYNQGASFYKHDQVGVFKENRTPPIKNDGLNEFIGNLVPYVFADERGPLGYLGQMQESGRDQSHTAMALGLAVDMCQVGWSQGDDMYGMMNNRLLAGIEYIAAYNTGVDDLPWAEYHYLGSGVAAHNAWVQTGNSDPGRGVCRNYWDRIISHYEGVKGIKLTYAHILKKNSPIDGGPNHGDNSGAFDHLGFSTLTCKRPAITADQAPTPLIATLQYKGVTHKASELGGLVNTYRNNTATSAVPAGSLITLIPTLPSGTTDTGNWLWDDGATTKDREITASASALYRVVYTNEKGVKTTQLYSIAVQGDCLQEKIKPLMESEGTTVNDTILEVQRGASCTLSASSLTGEAGWSSYSWNNGAKTWKITVDNILSDRTYSVVYTNQGGRQVKLNFHIQVNFMLPTLSVNNGAVQEGNKVVVPTGQSVELIPTVPLGKEDGVWQWSTGASTQNLKIENVQTSATYSVTYTYKGEEYILDFHVYIPASNKSFDNGNYYIKEVASGRYLTNTSASSNLPAFLGKDNEDAASQTWTLTKDGLRYKITSAADNRFLDENGQFTSTAYSITQHTYTLNGVQNGDFCAIQNSKNAGLNYWAVNADGTLKGKGTSVLSGYLFEIIPVENVDVEEVTLGEFAVYPNPAQDYLVINIEDNGPSVALFTLYSVDGRAVKTVGCKAGENTVQLNGLASGIYYGTLSAGGQQRTVTIVKK